MGQKSSKQASSSTAATTTTTKNTATATTNLPPQQNTTATMDDETTTIYYLKKKRPGCTGMFWRSDPTGQTKLTSNRQNWPKDGAQLKGSEIVSDKSGQKFLLCTHVKNANDKQWKEAPVGAALPFEYDNHYYLDDKEW